MAPSPRLDAVEVVLIVAESALYGIFLVLLIEAFESLYGRWQRGQQSKLLLSVSVFLFFTITGHLILDVARVFDAFIYLPVSGVTGYDPSKIGGVYDPTQTPATNYFQDLSLVKYVVVSAFYVTTTCVGDGFMIYRLWIVWGRNTMVVAFPVLMELALCATSGVIIWLLSKASGNIFVTAGGWITAYFSLTFATNLVSSLLIAYRVWLSKRNVSKLGVHEISPIQRVINTLVQSAALYSFCLLISLALYVQENNAQYIFAATNCPIVGITFTMIATRSGTRRGFESESTSEATRSLRTNIPLQTMAIKITTEVDHDADSASQRGADSSDPEFKGTTLDGGEHGNIHSNMKYSSAVSFEESMA